MNRRPRLKIPNQDLDAARTLASTLTEAEVVPILDRWTMVLELLPDDLLRYVTQARDRKEADLMNLLGPLSLVSAQALLGIDHTHPEFPMVATVASYGIMTSFVIELERRHKRFTSQVINLTNPFNLEPEAGKTDPFTLIPKDPDGEPVTLDTLLDYYGKPQAENTGDAQGEPVEA